MKIYFKIPLFLGMSFALSLVSCRGNFSEKSPIHPNPNMDFQPKKGAQSQKIQPVENVVPFARESRTPDESFVQSKARYFQGIAIAGDYIDVHSAEYASFIEASVNQTVFPAGISYAKSIPVPVTREFIIRGEEQFNIFCAACHDRVGTGNSIIMQRGVGFPRPPDLSSETIVAMQDGELFNVISHGRRNMPGYSLQVQTEDRWSIVAYIRTLQQSRNKTLQDVPAAQRVLLLREQKEYLDAQKTASDSLE